MHLAIVLPIQLRDFYSPELKSKIEDLNRRIADHESQKAGLSTRRVALQSHEVDLADVDFKKLESSKDRSGLADTQLAQNELRLRRDWNTVDDEAYEAGQREYTSCYPRLEAIRTEIQQRLESIGYKPFPGANGESLRGCWIPDMWQRHPEYRDATEAIGMLKLEVDDRTSRHGNEKQIERLEMVLELRRKALVGQPPTGAPIASSPRVVSGTLEEVMNHQFSQ